MSRSPDVSITLAEIARIAGVGRAAVSNWRRRHADFPVPVGGSDASPQFSLSTVELWLQQHAKLTDVGRLDRLWPEFEALGDISQSGAMIAAVGERLLARRVGYVRGVTGELAGDAELLVQRAVDAAGDNGDARPFDYLLERWTDAYVRQVSTTPPQLAALMAEVAQLVLGGDGGGSASVVLDPACGVGNLLLAAIQNELAGGSTLSHFTLIGVDRDPSLAALAAVLRTWQPYEQLPWPIQEAMLHAAAAALQLTADGRITARGVLGSAIQPSALSRVHEGDPPSPFRTAWIDSARRSAGGARPGPN